MNDALLRSVLKQAAGAVPVPPGLYPTGRVTAARRRRVTRWRRWSLAAVAAVACALLAAYAPFGRSLVAAATAWISTFRVQVQEGYQPPGGAFRPPSPEPDPAVGLASLTVADLAPGQWPLPTYLAPPPTTSVMLETTRTELPEGEKVSTILNLSYRVRLDDYPYRVDLMVDRLQLPERQRAMRRSVLADLQSGRDPAVISPSPVQTHQVKIHGQDTTVVDSGGRLSAIWYSEDGSVHLNSNLPLPEFVKLAESMPLAR